MTSATLPLTTPGSPVPLHRYAMWWITVLLLLTTLGFWPSFVTRLGSHDLAHTAHGMVSFGWLLLLIGQAWLIERKQRAWHRRVAMLGIPLALLMVLTAIPMMRVMLKAMAVPEARPVVAFLGAYDVGALIWFVVLFSVALANVRRPAMHARCLAATAFLGLAPGLGRFFMWGMGMSPFAAVHATMLLVEGSLLALYLSDRRAGIREWPYAGTLVFFVLWQGIMGPLATSDLFAGFASWLTAAN
jgi:hypothetical protein